MNIFANFIFLIITGSEPEIQRELMSFVKNTFIQGDNCILSSYRNSIVFFNCALFNCPKANGKEKFPELMRMKPTENQT